jgi:DNA-binding winged helix-turn-helix (wHTH) protein/tetratricopeptide (TPR) repeat protein
LEPAASDGTAETRRRPPRWQTLMSSEPTGCTHRFGDIDYNARTGELRRGARRTRLSPHLATLLDALIESPGELVAREALRARIWPDTNVDFEHGLTTAVNRLRELLGDSAHDHRLIETIPFRGYRWLVPVERVHVQSDQVPSPPDATLPSEGTTVGEPRVRLPVQDQAIRSEADTRTPRRWAGRPSAPVAVAVSILILVVAALGWSRLREPAPPIQPQPAGTAAAGPRESPELGPAAVPPEALEAYQRARFVPSSASEAQWRSSIKYLNFAIGHAPRFAQAHAELARVYTEGARYGFVVPGEAVPRARAAAIEALRLDDRLADPHVALGDVRLFFEWDWTGAESEYRRGLDLEPDSEYALDSYARLLAKAGRFDEAVALRVRLLERDPIDYARARSLAGTYIDARRFDDVLQALRPFNGPGHPAANRLRIISAIALAGKTQCPGALREADRAIALLDTSDDEVTLVAGGWVYATCGRSDLARELLGRYESPDRAIAPDPISLGALYAALGDTERGIQLVERGVNKRSPIAIDLDVDLMLDPLRRDPRFERLAAGVRGNRPAPRAGR